jgi:hypothetical protein
MSTAAPGVQAPSRAGFGPGRVVLIVLGAILAALGLALLAGGGAIVWANETQRDDSGYFTTSAERFSSSSYALTHEGVELFDATANSDWEEDLGDLATLRVRASGSATPLFMGIGPADDVDAYLRGVAHTDVDDVRYDPFSADFVEQDGGAPAGVPGHESFWAVTAGGARSERLVWPVEPGTWSLVVMNADGSRGVAADLEFGAKVEHLGWLAFGLLLAGALLGAGGGVLILLGARTPPGSGATAAIAVGAPAAADETAGYPTIVEGRLDPDGPSRWLWLVKWLLAIPHYVVLAFLWLAVAVLTVVAFFAILFTGRYPRGIFDFTVGVLRWTWRVGFYAYSVLGTDRYPPFTLEAVDYPATFDVPYPERLSRGLVLVKWWLLALPHYVILAIVFGNWGWVTDAGTRVAGPSLNGVLVLVAAIVLLFTGRYPRDIFELVVGFNRWALRVAAYALLLRDEYPPFRLGR